MEQPLYNAPLSFRHISEVAKETLEYIDLRRKHEIEPLITRWRKFNRVCSIEPGTIYTIVGASGSGKSAFASMLENDFCSLNPNKDIIILSFSFEMLSSQQVGRKISGKLGVTTNTLYSGERDISDTEFKTIEAVANDLSKYPIYYVDTAANVAQIAATIAKFQEKMAKDKWLVIVLDHTLLVRGKSEENALSIIRDLQNCFINAKKVGCTTIIQLSQMNRNIESPDRINNPSCHYPMRSDISSADAIFQGSDVVLVIARPETLGFTIYGPHRLPVQNKIYIHILKNREGQLAILDFENDLAHNNIIEIDRQAEANPTD